MGRIIRQVTPEQLGLQGLQFRENGDLESRLIRETDTSIQVLSKFTSLSQSQSFRPRGGTGDANRLASAWK